MNIYPAIDIHNGRCVRLKKGDFATMREYAESPVTLAQAFQKQGATWLHIVDLDGAKDPLNHQHALISEITHNTNLNIQMGGGIRTGEQIQALLANGVKRVILGSVAVTHPEQVSQWLREFGSEKIVIALDVRFNSKHIPMVTMHGWQEISNMPLMQVIEYYQAANLQHILCTDIECVGLLEGPNFSLYQQLKNRYPKLMIQASGGIASLNDIQTLSTLHLSSVVVGSAFYESRFTLPQVLQLQSSAC